MAQTLAPTFGDLLKQSRKRAGMTQGDLASALGYSISFVSALEQNRRLPDVDAVLQVFVPALGLQDEPHLATRLVELAASARGERPPVAITRQRERQIVVTEARSEPAPHLPVAPTDLIGRAQEVRQLCQRLPGHAGRLLTLVGSPGIGKTSLALAVAAQLHYHYRDGAAFVALATISDAVLMAATIVTSVGSNDTSSKAPKTKLIEYLRRKTMLLVLDNLEQIRDAAQLITDVLAECPGVCVLATSRERLHLRAEQRFHVPPLDIAPAIELFVARAQAVHADFRLTPQNQPTIAAICQRLDCLPLALELCAAQIDLLAPAQLLAHLHDRRLDLLVEGSRDLPPQHRTLRNAIQRSYELLSDDERTLFRHLGIFVGGCTLEAIEAVCAWETEPHARPLLVTLHALIGKSLVRAEPMPTGESRFRLLETIREFALEQLRAQGEEQRLHERHYTAYLEFVRTADSSLRTLKPTLWLARLQPEQDNIRVALQWTLDEQRYTDTAWLIVAVSGFWFHNVQWPETGQWIARLLPQRHTLDIDLRLALMTQLYALARSFEAFQPLERWNAEMQELLDACPNMHLHANAWRNIALQHYFTPDYPRAVAGWERAIACARAAGAVLEPDTRFCMWADHSWLLGGLLWAYANALVNQGEFEPALPLLLESRDIFQQRGLRSEMSRSLGTLGLLALLQGDLTGAYAQLKEAVAIAMDINQYTIGFWQPVLGFVTLYTGDVAGARRILTASLRLCTELKDPMLLARTMTFLAETALWEGKNDEAAHWLAQSLEHRDPGITIIYHVVQLFVAARVAAAQGQYPRAALLFGLAEQANSQIHHAYAGPLRSHTDSALATVRAALDPVVFAEAYAAGERLSLKEAFATVLHPTAIAL